MSIQSRQVRVYEEDYEVLKALRADRPITMGTVISEILNELLGDPDDDDDDDVQENLE